MTTAAHTVPADKNEWKNMFGVCACIAEDFGFNPLWLRLAFALPLIWMPLQVIIAYFALGVIVLSSRLIFPNRKPTASGGQIDTSQLRSVMV